LKKVVSDRRAALDEATEIRPAVRKLVEQEFARRASLPIIHFPEDGAAIPDAPRLSLVVIDPEVEWQADGEIARSVAQWTLKRGASSRLYPASIVWCARKPGRELRDRVELWLAWKRVQREVAEGLLGTEFDQASRQELRSSVKDAETAARDEVWACYRFVALADSKAGSGLRMIDLGAGHSSSNETLCGRVLTALKTEALLSETVGAGYLDRHWPPAFKETGAWPLKSLRQSFLNGSLTRLVDPDAALRQKIVAFVESGSFGLASGGTTDGRYERVWFKESVGTEEVAFEPDVFLLTRARCEALRAPPPQTPPVAPTPDRVAEPLPSPAAGSVGDHQGERQLRPSAAPVTLLVSGTVPAELWNRFGTKLIPKLRTGAGLTAIVELSAEFNASAADSLESDIKNAIADLKLDKQITFRRL